MSRAAARYLPVRSLLRRLPVWCASSGPMASVSPPSFAMVETRRGPPMTYMTSKAHHTLLFTLGPLVVDRRLAGTGAFAFHAAVRSLRLASPSPASRLPPAWSTSLACGSSTSQAHPCHAGRHGLHLLPPGRPLRTVRLGYQRRRPRRHLPLRTAPAARWAPTWCGSSASVTSR